MATNGIEQVTAAEPHNDVAPTTATNISKDEVGWYFVEQYYTTLSKSPEKLHLFYGKRSQFVYGLEAEVANVSVGRQAIQERIKKLDFQDCKVRVSNVDSQASFDNIVIQVIGEVSNKSGEPQKFVQTFVLAQQPSGYFVLNDILRYINEDGEEVQQQKEQEQVQDQEQEQEQEQSAEVETEVSAAQAEAAIPEPVANNEPEVVEPEPVQPEAVEDVVDEKVQDASAVPEEANVQSKAPEAVETKVEEPTPAAAETDAKEPVEETAKEADKTKEPTPAPAAKPAAPAPTPAEPAAPPKPMTWASRAAAAAGPRPVVPLPKTATPPAATQTRAPAPTAAPASAPAPAAAAAAAPAAPAAAAASATAEAPAKEASGWQTAGADSKRQSRPQPTAANVSDKEGTMGYVKYVTEKVQDADLRAVLAAHGELTYFDINRTKNCAFVEYKTVEAYQAALASNPQVVNGENTIVEPRRPKSTTYGGGNYGSGRGGASGRGRGGFDGNRSGGQGNPRGNFPGSNRGRGGAARGRGGAQAATSS